MPKNNKIFKKIALLCIAVVVVIIAWGGLVPEIASSQQVESRLNALQSDIYGIESRLNRIEDQIGQLRQARSPRAPAEPPPSRLNSERIQPELNRDEMFDRLATLVVELKQQVNELEARVCKLESTPEGIQNSKCKIHALIFNFPFGSAQDSAAT